mmetsp:Transcript_139612/g.197697  ORF Transcript_139612/g.197697 Transcript_139612/m.197697 type:complete len:172 (-) Transcript_139612:423-938(-)
MKYKKYQESQPQAKKFEFSHQSDVLLVGKIHQHGLNWTKIALEVGASDPIRLKNRYYSSIKKRGAYNELLEEWLKNHEGEAIINSQQQPATTSQNEKENQAVNEWSETDSHCEADDDDNTTEIGGGCEEKAEGKKSPIFKMQNILEKFGEELFSFGSDELNFRVTSFECLE